MKTTTTDMKTKKMEIKKSNNRLETIGGYLNYTNDDEEIIIELVCSEIPRKGIGSTLVRELQKIASDINKPIGLYAEPCAMCGTEIMEDDLIRFYENLGFELDPDDTDGKLMIWNR